MPILSTLGNAGCMSRRGKRWRSKGLGYFSCPTKNIKSKRIRNRHLAINKYAEQHRINRLHFLPTVLKGKIKKIKKVRTRTRVMSGLRGLSSFRGDSCSHKFNRSRVGHKQHIHYMKKGNLLSNIGNFLGGMKVRRKRKSLGRTLAQRARIRRGKCKKVVKRKVCRTASGKGFIKRDIMARRHSSSGAFNGIGSIGMPYPSQFGGRGRWRNLGRKRKGHRRGSRRSLLSLRGFGLGAISIPPSIKSILPPIDKDFLMKSATIVSGAFVPLTLSRMDFIPAGWKVGWKGLVVYTVIGGVFLKLGQRIEFIKKRHAELATGFGVGLVLQIMQNYIFKKTLIPAQNTKAVPALSGLEACTSCVNAEGCGDVGDCLGYSDGAGDYMMVNSDDEDEDFGGLYDDVVESLEELGN